MHNSLKDDNKNIWLFYVSNLIVRKICKDPGYILTIEIDYMTKQGRSKLENEFDHYIETHGENAEK